MLSKLYHLNYRYILQSLMNEYVIDVHVVPLNSKINSNTKLEKKTVTFFYHSHVKTLRISNLYKSINKSIFYFFKSTCLTLISMSFIDKTSTCICLTSEMNFILVFWKIKVYR
jgi:hypothetical protein